MNYYDAIGFYSPVYGLTYYNGYGYNFYYGQYGYYEYSVNQTQTTLGAASIIIVIAVILFCFLCICGVQRHRRGGNSEDVRFESGVHIEYGVDGLVKHEQVTTTVVEHHQEPQYYTDPQP